MMQPNTKSVRKISNAVRNSGGVIIGFELQDNTFLKHEDALKLAKEGLLEGINLYPDFVKEVNSGKGENKILSSIINLLVGK